MYSRSLSVGIFCSNAEVYNVIKQVPPLEKYNLEVELHSQVDLSGIPIYDVIIADISVSGEALSAVSSQKKKEAFLILCGDSSEISSLDEDILPKIHSIWTYPLNETIIKLNYRNLLKEIKLQKDKDLSDKYLYGAINGISDLVWFKDSEGKHVLVNDAFCATACKTKEDIAGKDDIYVWNIDPKIFESGDFDCANTDNIVLKTKEPFCSSENLQCPDGLHQFKTYKAPILDELGNAVGTVGIARDVTNLQNMQMELEIVIENMSVPVLISDIDNKILKTNSKYSDLFSVSPEEINGKNIPQFLLNPTEGYQGDGYQYKATDRGFYLFLKGRIYKIERASIWDIFKNHTGHIYIFTDITMEYQYEVKLLKSAMTDYLTGLNNRHGLNKYVIKRNNYKNTAFVMFDLDNFKNVNDSLGHSEGDNLLRDFSKILLKHFSKENVFRMGGDEFLVTLFNIIDEKEVHSFIQQAIDDFTAYASKKLLEHSVTLSAGIAINKEDDISFDDLLNRADNAMYDAKRQGKDRIAIWNS